MPCCHPSTIEACYDDDSGRLPIFGLLSPKTMSTGSSLQLYSYCWSSCAWRVRIALNLKGLEYEYKPVNLLKGEQFSPEFLELNPLGFVPVLVDGDTVVGDSLAILLYLEEKYPDHPLLPDDLKRRAINIQVAHIVSSSIQPYQNLAVRKYIDEKLNSDETSAWLQYHIGKGFTALEKLLQDYVGKYATGDEVFLADVFLAPQICDAIHLFKLDVSGHPLLLRLLKAYSEIPEFEAARPEVQPDAVNPSK